MARSDAATQLPASMFYDGFLKGAPGVDDAKPDGEQVAAADAKGAP
jgi:hypothetical protein